MIIIAILVIGYKMDTATCEKIIEEPCSYCKGYGCCDEGIVEPDFNFSDYRVID